MLALYFINPAFGTGKQYTQIEVTVARLCCSVHRVNVTPQSCDFETIIIYHQEKMGIHKSYSNQQAENAEHTKLLIGNR